MIIVHNELQLAYDGDMYLHIRIKLVYCSNLANIGNPILNNKIYIFKKKMILKDTFIGVIQLQLQGHV
ncbi:hypothetical protein A8C58_15005 [Enterococcus faecium]|nr:hypothetical protein A8C58_15005 [Enterococcus faecium]